MLEPLVELVDLMALHPLLDSHQIHTRCVWGTLMFWDQPVLPAGFLQGFLTVGGGWWVESARVQSGF